MAEFKGDKAYADFSIFDQCVRVIDCLLLIFAGL